MMTSLEICVAFAAKRNIIFEPEGGCGIGRKCVGFLGKNGNWIDYNPIDMETYDPIKYLECEALEPPKGTDAYHKHNCLAVLGRGEVAINGLASWVVKMELAGTVEIKEYSTGATGRQAAMTGATGYTVVVK